ncbi:MAG: c-type cytochrome, partial [Planctomycetes bacterium]|nr:c-type cytochrome [Planctomycetota bacterium]
MGQLPFTLPPGTAIVAADGKDAGLRFVDLDADGYDDVIFSNAERYSIHLFTDMQKGWSKEVMSGKRAEKDARDELPMIVRGDGSNNGFWVHSRHFWWQNEDTAALKDHVDRRSFNELLAHVEPGPKSPEASLRSIRTRPGFEVELVAAEPLVMDPIAFAWGQDGKLWVVEMADYPLGVDDKGQFGGRVRYLEDTDGDGRYDRSTLFLDGLGYPTGVMPWRKGVLVTCAPDIFYAEDRDGDGRADVKEVLFTGFVEGNQQHRVNGLVWGLDNWVYLANGDSGGTIKSLRTPSGSPRSQGGEGEVEISGRDLRIRPDEGLIDPQSGQSQFGRSRDDWGNWFGCNNSNPIYHFVLADHYLRRNAHVAAPDPRRNVSVTPGNAPVYPISRTLERFNDPGNFNRFTSACSVIVYRDELFGPAFAGNAFVSEPVHNLVHREIMSADGLSFTSRRAPDEQQSEFLASSDNWFRPTTIKTGPDGALWIADMYRYVIEHPEWIPDDWEARLDLRAGHDKGRIYRVYPVGRPPRKIPRLDQLSTAELVAALDSPNGWQRDMAQQLLIWRNDMAAVEPLEQLVAQSERAACRLQALCTLDGLGAVRSETIQQALSDPHPGVRRHAVRIAESRLSEEPEVGAAVLRLVNDSDLHVRMQLAYSLGEWDDPRAGQALGRLAVESADSPYLVAAVMSSAANHLDEILPAVFNSTARKTQVPNLLNLAIAVRNENALTGALKNVVTGVFPAGYASWQFDFLGEFLDVLDRRSISLSQLQADAGPHLRSAIDSLSFMFKTARTIARSEERSLGLRVAALRVLGREDVSRQAEDIKTLSSLLVPQTPGDLQEVAVETLGRIRSERVPQLLLDAWPASGPRVRAAILDALLSREPWRRELLDRIENGQVAAGEIDAARRHRLIEQAPQAMRERARTLLAQSQGADRQQVLDAYRAALPSKGDAQRGAAVFEKTCSTCHRVGDVGHDIGPDLKALTDRSPEAMLVAILDPNRAVESKFTSYVAVTTDGRTWTGMLASETGNSITLVSQEGKEQAILRSELESLESTGKSLMPDGVEKDVTPQDVADLLAYLSSAAPGPKPLKNSKPTLVTAGADGTLRLLAASAEIYGDTLVLEDQYGNLGFWSSANDHAVWSLEAPKAGKYEVWLHWACDDRTAGNAFLIEAGAA